MVQAAPAASIRAHRDADACVGPARGQPAGQAAILDLNRRIRELSLKSGNGPAVELFDVFAREPSLIGRDGVHPNSAGYVRMAEIFFEAIKAHFEVSGTTPAGFSEASHSFLVDPRAAHH